MAIPTPAFRALPPRTPPAILRAVRVILYLGLTLLLVACIGAIWFYAVARSALPQLDGSIRLPGLHQSVTVIRDAHGVPHLRATSLEDLFFAQGYVTAQDRLWQMDALRRYAAGDLSEILGGSFLPHDRKQRILQLRWAAVHAAEKIPAAELPFYQAYARGVNAFVESHRDKLPIEFRVLRYQPRPWTVEDSILIGTYMNQLLNTEFDVKLSRERITALLTPQLAADLYPNRSWRDHPPTAVAADITAPPPVPGAIPSDATKAPAETSALTAPRDSPRSASFAPASVAALLDLVRHPQRALPSGLAGGVPDSEAFSAEALLPGSNNWVISGAHTATGKPFLANDMHLPHSVPGIWYEAHLESGGYNVAGLTLPGLPHVIAGHNAHIAWGYTNLGPDVQDLFIETFNAAGQYQTPAGWQQPEQRTEIIRVKGQPDVQLTILVTRHGPIISELVPGESRKLALKWTLYDPLALHVPLFDINSAQDWSQFRAAFSHYGGPSQNVVYADTEGHIGYTASGLIPTRASGDGSLPVAGSDDAHEWTGYVPFEQLPSVLDPPGGIIATANSRITPDNYPYSLATQWFPPYRTERIYRVLAAAAPRTAADMLALQTDVYSEFDRFIADRLVYAIDHVKQKSARAQQAADIMRAWDGNMSATSAAPTIVVLARRNLYRLLLQPKLGEAYKQYSWGYQSVALENILMSQPPRWLPPNYADFNQLLVAAVEAAVTEKPAPHDLRSWTWGDFAPVDIEHPIFQRVPLLKGWAAPGLHAQSGGSYTVKQVGRTFGPSERELVDFANLDDSTLNIVQGQSGQIFSPYYMDHWPAWYEGRTFTLPFTGAAIDRVRAHTLDLVPAQ